MRHEKIRLYAGVISACKQMLVSCLQELLKPLHPRVDRNYYLRAGHVEPGCA